MAQVTLQVNGRTYQVGCPDGQEAHLGELAALFDSQVRQLAAAVGPLDETRLLLMGALTLADDLAEARGRLGELQSEAARLRQALAALEARAAAALEAAARRIEVLAGQAAAPDRQSGDGLLL